MRLAVQAPTSTNTQNWHFVVVTDEAKRAALAELYLRSWIPYNGGQPPGESAGRDGLAATSPPTCTRCRRTSSRASPGRPEGLAPADLAWFYGSIIQAGWSFQLAARARGLGSVWTTHHLDYEREAADVLGIPFDEVTQIALIPVAYTVGTDFKPAQAQPARDGAALADLVTPRAGAPGIGGLSSIRCGTYRKCSSPAVRSPAQSGPSGGCAMTCRPSLSRPVDAQGR